MANFKPENSVTPLTIDHIEGWYEYLICPSHIYLEGTTIQDQYLTGRRNQHGAVLSNVHHRVIAHGGLIFKLRRTMSAKGTVDWGEWKLLWVAPMSESEIKLINNKKVTE